MNKKKVILVFFIFAFVLHAVIFPFSFSKTYDAFVHIFFAQHCLENWFHITSMNWYGGFEMASYPPFSHQFLIPFLAIFLSSITLCSLAFGQLERPKKVAKLERKKVCLQKV